MKIAIISDIHDNLVNLEKCLNWCNKEKVEQLICCGDVTNSETLQFLAAHFKGIIYLVKGNAEIYNENEVKQYKNIKYYGKIGKVELDGKIIGICHEPAYIPEVISLGNNINKDRISANNRVNAEISAGKPYLIDCAVKKSACDIIFYGHTHKPWAEERDSIKLYNPGTLGGMFSKGTFAVMENDKIELKILELL